MGNPSQTDNMGEKGSGRNQQQTMPVSEPPLTTGPDRDKPGEDGPTGEHPDGFERTNGGARGKRVLNR